MSGGQDEPGFDFGALNEVPLFREIQRVLLSSSGPVNWELARQVGIATAVSEAPGDDRPPTEADRAALSESVRIAELAVAELTGLPQPTELATVQVMRRADWVQAGIAGLRDLVEPVAERLSRALAEQAGSLGAELPGGDPDEGGSGEGGMPFGFQPGATPFPGLGGMPGGEEGGQFMGLLLQQMGPLLLGLQVGSVLGDLARRVLGQYDLPVPRPGSVVGFVAPNIAGFEREWSLPPMEFRLWVALHEVVHRFEFAGHWVRPHFNGLVGDLMEHAELDLAGLQRRMQDVDLSNPEAMSEALQGADAFFGSSDDPEQRLRIARVQAFFAAAEGYGDHVTDKLGRRMLPSLPRIEEALLRHREGRHGDQALERLLGLRMGQEHYALGRMFCATVAELSDEATLARMWESAEAMPAMPELEEPRLWLARIA
jgi:putative hydrolase